MWSRVLMLFLSTYCCQRRSCSTSEGIIQKECRDLLFYCRTHVWGLTEGGTEGRGRNGWRVSHRKSASAGRLRFHGDRLSARRRSLSAQRSSHHLRGSILRVFTQKNTFWNTSLYCTKIFVETIIYLKMKTIWMWFVLSVYCNNVPVKFAWIWF